jgi:hypothetical protein
MVRATLFGVPFKIAGLAHFLEPEIVQETAAIAIVLFVVIWWERR